MTARKVVVIAENAMSKSKTMLEMTSASLDAHWESTTSLMHGSCNDDMIQLSPLSFLCSALGRRDQSRMFCTPCRAVFPTL